jgi:hypothetical protein
MCILYNQRDAFLLSTAGVDWMDPIHTSGREQESTTIPKAAHTVLYAPHDGRKYLLKHAER